jgi:hypothetical protein
MLLFLASFATAPALGSILDFVFLMCRRLGSFELLARRSLLFTVELHSTNINLGQ